MERENRFFSDMALLLRKHLWFLQARRAAGYPNHAYFINYGFKHGKHTILIG